ncbi:hypothetical protein [Sedimentibacter sp.]|uniref:hypothetical protein n=1 Tax=Sedimentibacter sp. TaxID=1960295 RepID=UPI0028AC56B3|nr:hypothetical protein [Sedimentibacter sp.]
MPIHSLKYNSKTLLIISLLLTLTGIIFILAAKFIGSIAIRIAILIFLGFLVLNIKMTYSYISNKERLNYIIAFSASVLGLIKPEFTMLLIGIIILCFVLPPYINIIKSGNYSDMVSLIINGTGILFAFYCIINSKAALNTVIIIIGIILTISGCLLLYNTLTSE